MCPHAFRPYLQPSSAVAAESLTKGIGEGAGVGHTYDAHAVLVLVEASCCVNFGAQ